MKYYFLVLALILLPANSYAQDAQPPPQNPYRLVTLFFPGPDLRLAGEGANILRDAVEEREIKSAADLLSAGSVQFQPALPKTAKVETVFLDQQKTVYLDYNEDFINAHPGGVTREIITVAAICKTIFVNFEAEGLRFLVKGKEIRTLAGHVDLESKLTRKKCDALAFFRRD